MEAFHPILLSLSFHLPFSFLFFLPHACGSDVISHTLLQRHAQLPGTTVPTRWPQTLLKRQASANRLPSRLSFCGGLNEKGPWARMSA